MAWQVQNELNILKYEVEKSTTGSNFLKMFTVSVSGTNNAQNNYQWTDKRLYSNKVWGCKPAEY